MRDPYQCVLKFNQNRDPQFLARKYKLMASSPFRFYRGSCHLFYEDLSMGQTWQDTTRTWICGDLHIENFGTYRSRYQVVYFDINDFDEAVLAHPTWELARFLCSIFLAGWELKLKDDDLKTTVLELLEQYLLALKGGKAYAIEKECVKGIVKKYIKTVAERDHTIFVDSRTILDSNNQKRLLIDFKKYFAIEDEKLKTALILQFTEHLAQNMSDKKANYQVLDVAIRVAGTGSIGLKRYVFLVYNDLEKSYHLFDMKQAIESSLNIFSDLKTLQPRWENQAQRIQFVQNIMEYETPAYLSTQIFQDQAYIVKALQPDQDKLDFKQCEEDPKKFTEACIYMAQLMAYAQIRSSGRLGSSSVDELIAFAEQAEHWKADLLNYTYHYAQQVVQDHQSFVKEYQA